MEKRLSKVVSRFKDDTVEIRIYSFAGRGRHALHSRSTVKRADILQLFGGGDGNPDLLMKAERQEGR